MNDNERPPEPTDSRIDDEDTEGQSMAAMLAMRELTKREAHASPRTDEQLPALTKKFPRMRDDNRK
jgi:hypothetical protein